MNINLINIGDELLIGQVVNTNASWMATYLNDNGMRVKRVFTIADNIIMLDKNTGTIAETDSPIVNKIASICASNSCISFGVSIKFFLSICRFTAGFHQFQ